MAAHRYKIKVHHRPLYTHHNEWLVNPFPFCPSELLLQWRTPNQPVVPLIPSRDSLAIYKEINFENGRISLRRGSKNSSAPCSLTQKLYLSASSTPESADIGPNTTLMPLGESSIKCLSCPNAVRFVPYPPSWRTRLAQFRVQKSL